MSGFNPDYKPQTAHVILNQEQTQAIRALLQLVHYDDLAQSWSNLLPKVLQVQYRPSQYDKDFDLAENEPGGS